MSARFEELVQRLASPHAGARRVAVHDLIALGDPGVHAVLVEHLKRESDEAAALLIIRKLAGVPGAGPALLRLYENPATPVRIAHAAILAHDALAV